MELIVIMGLILFNKMDSFVNWG